MYSRRTQEAVYCQSIPYAIWVFVAVASGIAIGHFVSSAAGFVDGFQRRATSIPIVIGLVIMMFPRWQKFGTKSWSGLSEQTYSRPVARPELDHRAVTDVPPAYRVPQRLSGLRATPDHDWDRSLYCDTARVEWTG